MGGYQSQDPCSEQIGHQRLESADALASGRSAFRPLLSILHPIAIATIDKNGVVGSTNAAFAHMFARADYQQQRTRT